MTTRGPKESCPGDGFSVLSYSSASGGVVYPVASLPAGGGDKPHAAKAPEARKPGVAGFKEAGAARLPPVAVATLGAAT